MADAKKQEQEGFFRRTGHRLSSRKQVIQNALVVLLCVLVVGVFIWIFDAVGNLFVQWLIGLFN